MKKVLDLNFRFIRLRSIDAVTVIGKRRGVSKPKTEDRRPKTEDRRPKTEDRRPKTEDQRPKTWKSIKLNVLKFFFRQQNIEIIRVLVL